MKRNMSNLDRGIRVLIALIVIGLYFAHIISGTVAIVLLAISAIFILTSFVSFCPLYALFGISTRKAEKHNYQEGTK